MSLDCTKTVGLICLHVAMGTTSINCDNAGLGSLISISAKNSDGSAWTASSITTDVVTRVEAAKWASQCSQGKCIRYARKCNDSARPTACDYSFASGSSAWTISLKSERPEGLEAARESIALIMDGPDNNLPFTAFAGEASK